MRKWSIKLTGLKKLGESISKHKTKILSFFYEKLKWFKSLLKRKEKICDDELTYYPKNGWHIWDYDDVILALFFFRLKQETRKMTDNYSYSMSIDHSVINIKLKRIIDIESEELAENIIGCVVSALDIHSLVIEHLITGAHTGHEHPNEHEILISKKLNTTSLNELIEMSNEIIEKISNNRLRIEQNKIAKDIRLKSAKVNDGKISTKTKQKTIGDINKTLKEKHLDNINTNKLIPIEKGITIEIGYKMNHPKYGIGNVIESFKDSSNVNFNIGKNGKEPVGVKKISNKFIHDYYHQN